jgi:hypothetical protein
MTDADLKRHAREFHRGIVGRGPPHGMCYAVCAPLAGFLAVGNVHTVLGLVDFGWTNHAWLRLHDERRRARQEGYERRLQAHARQKYGDDWRDRCSHAQVAQEFDAMLKRESTPLPPCRCLKTVTPRVPQSLEVWAEEWPQARIGGQAGRHR